MRRQGVSLRKLTQPPIRLALKRPYGPNRSFNPQDAASPCNIDRSMASI